MSQHDFNIANQGFPATRSDINNALAALASTSSGTSEPSTTYANQFWYDTTNNLLKFRNEADSAWITLAYLDQSNNEWEIRSAVIQAVDSAGISLKTDDGTARVVIQDDGDVAFDTDTLFVDAANNRVGVGTSSPANGKLVVENNGSNLYLKQTTGDYGHIIGQNDADGALTFSRRDGGNSERMQISANGNITFGSFNASGGSVGVLFDVGGSTSETEIQTSVNGTATRTHYKFINNNGAVGTITTNGSATAFNTSSDHRLKENVTDVTDGITRVKQLAPKRFNFISDEDTTVDGFLAHEAQTVVPEAVTGTHNEVDGDGNPVYQGIDQSKLVPLLTAALQEAITKIEDLETRVAALESA